MGGNCRAACFQFLLLITKTTPTQTSQLTENCSGHTGVAGFITALSDATLRNVDALE